MEKDKFMIVEGVHGYYHYHIAFKEIFTTPLCDEKQLTMQTSIPMSAWGKVGHLRERYCAKCKNLYDKVTEDEP